MDVQKISGLSAASASPTLRPAIREDAAVSGARQVETFQARISQIESSLSAYFPPQLKLQLDVDSNTGTVVGRVVDRKTGEFVRQVPSEEMIALMARSAEVSAILNKTV